jgi:hypothetical protein
MSHVILALLLAVGADRSQTAANEVVARGPGFAWAAHVYEHSLIGPLIEMGLYGHTMRGRAWGLPTQLEWDGQRVVGQAGDQPVNLLYEVEADGGLRLDGMLVGALTHLEIGPVGIRGHIGGHDFALDDEGRQIVTGARTPYELEIPPGLATREAGQVAASVSVLLAGLAVPREQLHDAIAGIHKPILHHAELFRVSPPPGWRGPNPAVHVPVGGIGGALGAGAGGSPSTSGSMRHHGL